MFIVTVQLLISKFGNFKIKDLQIRAITSSIFNDDTDLHQVVGEY